jgi:hypothetical protein
MVWRVGHYPAWLIGLTTKGLIASRERLWSHLVEVESWSEQLDRCIEKRLAGFENSSRPDEIFEAPLSIPRWGNPRRNGSHR